MTGTLIRFCLAGITASLMLVGPPPGMAGNAVAQEVSFEGARINVIIGTSPGGGTDGTTRLVGRFMEKYLPGNPQMVYRNMPAGHGVVATNYFANEAKADGSFWMGGGNAYIDANTLRKSVVKYDPTKFEFIGGVARGGSVISLRKEKLKNFSDKSLPPAVVGTPDGSDTWAEMIAWGAELLGWNVRFVVGYPGTASLLLAARRGEIDSFGTSNIEMLRSLEKTGNFAFVAQNGQREGGKVVPRSAFPDVPTMPSLVEGKLSGIAGKAFEYWEKSNQIDKWYALPPGTPAKVVGVYAAAYEKVFRDEAFLKMGRHQFSADFGGQSRADMTDLVKSTSYPDVEILDHLRSLKVKNGLPAEALSAAEMAKLAAKLGLGNKIATKLVAVERGGRVIKFEADGKAQSARISGSRTKVTIGGKASKRGALAAGMACEVSYAGDGGEAQLVACR